jgi:hypothetical protein
VVDAIGWIDDHFHLIVPPKDQMPTIDFILHRARAAVLRCGRRQPVGWRGCFARFGGRSPALASSLTWQTVPHTHARALTHTHMRAGMASRGSSSTPTTSWTTADPAT